MLLVVSTYDITRAKAYYNITKDQGQMTVAEQTKYNVSHLE